MTEPELQTTCGSCGQSIEEDPGIPSEKRSPCPHFGSTLRAIHVSVQETISIREKLQLQGKEDGKKRPVLEQVHGDDLQRKTGIWMKRSRIIDRKNDLYHETVTNPETEEVLRECKEPLSEHRGHGAAKRKFQN